MFRSRRKKVVHSRCCPEMIREAEERLAEALNHIESSVREKRVVRLKARIASQKAATIPHLALVGSKR